MLNQPNIARDDSVTAIRFPIRLLTVNLLLTIVVFVWFGWIVFDARHDVKVFTVRVSRIEELRGVITHLDEVLTMSARMAAATGDSSWEARYRQFEPQLDAAIKESMDLATDPTANGATARTDEANIKLVAMENQAFALIRAGRKEEAQQVLFSPEYETQKRIYAEGEASFINEIRRGFDDNLRADQRFALLLVIVALVVGGILFLAWFMAVRGVHRWRIAFERSISERARSEGAQRESEERYRELFENARDAIYVHDLNGTYVSANLAAQQLSGYPLDEIVGKKFVDFLAPEFADQIRARLSQTVDAHADATYEVELINRNGQRVPVEVSSRRIYEQGIAVGVQGMVRDLTERKRAEAERQAISEIVHGAIATSNLDELFSLAHQAISKLLPAENCFVALYDQTTGLLNIPFFRDEFDPVPAPLELGRGLTAFVLRSGRPMLLTPELIQELASKGDIELGGTLPAAWLGAPLRTSTDIIGVLVVQHYGDKDAYSQQDLELLASVGDQLGLAIERKRIEIALKTNEMQLNAAQQIAHIGSWEWDNINEKLHWSEELFRIFGAPQELEVTFKGYLRYVHPDDRKLVMRSIKQVLGGGEFPEFDYRVIRSDGNVRTLQVNSKAIADATGRVTRMWGTTQDITERKRIEVELKTNEMQLTAAQHIANLGSWEWNVLTNKVRWSNELYRIFGLQPENADSSFGKFLTYVHPDDRKLMEGAIQQALSDKRFTTCDYRIISTEGAVRVVQCRGEVVVDETGRVTSLWGTLQDITERKRAEKEREVISEITQSVNLTANLDELLTLIHKSLRKVVYAENCFVALYDKETGLFSRCFYVDQRAPNTPPIKLKKSCSAYVYHTGRPLLMNDAKFQELLEQGEVEQVGASAPSWLGVPLKTALETIGVLVVQHYEKDDIYTEQDVEFLTAVGSQIALAIERKRADEALIESERRFRDLFYDAPVGYHELDIEGRITCVNTTELLMLGYSSEEMIGHHVWEFIGEAEVARQTFAKKTAGTMPLSHVERTFRRKDGTFMDVQLDDQMLSDPSGQIIGIRATMQDIGERKQAEQALRDSEGRFRDLFENASDLVCTMDLKGNLISLNKSGERMTGYTESEALKMNLTQMVTPQALGLTREMTKRKLEQDVTTTYEIDLIRKDGGKVTLEISSRLLHQHGKEIGLQAIGRDITQRKQVEAELKQARDAALESVRLKSEFLANMSHEIRTPMNGVIGMTGLLLETELTAAQLEYSETIQSSAEALLTIINDILDFSKIEAGRLRFENIDFELRGAVEVAVEDLAERARRKGLELASLVYRDVPTALRGDPGRLRQVLTNLIGNAVKFTEHGEVVVSVTKVSETVSDAVMRFEIQDTGIGISAAAQSGLFQAFTQADGSTTRKYGGTGLGLAISKQLVELMSGEIGIESTPGAGSTFWFTAKFEKQLPLAPMVTEAAGNLSGARLLIVDDNAANRRILNHQTSSWGMIATAAESGKQALALLRAGASQGEPFDVAILDLLMPEMNGFQLAEAIKADPAIAGVALVLLPSFGKRGHGEQARQAGIAAYLQKPVRQAKLHDCLTKVLGGLSSDEPLTPARLVTRHSLRESEVEQKESTFSNVRIIIAEDNLVNQKVALRQLYNLGFRAEAVPNGRELLKTLETADFDLILMDCQMPELDGFEATAEIRRREGTARHTIIIAMTANALDGDAEKCLAAGMDDYLSKPVKAEVLRQKVEAWVRPAETALTGGVVSDDLPRAARLGNSPAVLPGNRRGGVLDRSQLVSLRLIQEPGEADFVTELIDLFLDEATAQLKALHEALLKDDAAQIQRVAHRLKGSSANLGATQMAALAQALDCSDPATDARALLGQLENEFELVREALNAERKELEDELLTPLAGT